MPTNKISWVGEREKNELQLVGLADVTACLAGPVIWWDHSCDVQNLISTMNFDKRRNTKKNHINYEQLFFSKIF